jgi:hypothetical protein
MRKINIRPSVPNLEQHGGRVLIPRQQRPPLPYDGAKGKRIAKAVSNVIRCGNLQLDRP